MAKPALDRFARPTFHDKRLAFGEAPDWYIGCEGRSRIPAFETEQIVGDLRQPCKVRVFRTAGSGGAVTKSAREHTGFAAVCDDIRQCAVVTRVPNRRN